MSQQPEVDKSTDSKKAKELFYKSAKRLGLVTYPEAGMIACGIAAVGVNAVTNLSFPYIMGKAVDIASAGIATSPGFPFSYAKANDKISSKLCFGI